MAQQLGNVGCCFRAAIWSLGIARSLGAQSGSALSHLYDDHRSPGPYLPAFHETSPDASRSLSDASRIGRVIGAHYETAGTDSAVREDVSVGSLSGGSCARNQ